ncbi:5'-methylthioadenosine/S-adenosylhomocysteine nucleosidase [Thermoflexales bacterium]|nr:5'-methylthioadenosine/S-adenosylhomocysteine nucleosidase [Thermoflexales bacterium]
MSNSTSFESENGTSPNSSKGVSLRIIRTKGDDRFQFERGLNELGKYFKEIGGEDFREFEDYRTQLLTNLQKEKRFGGNSELISKRAEISSSLNSLVIHVLNESFNDFALGNLKCDVTTVPKLERQAIDFAIITALEKEAKAVVKRLNEHSIVRYEDKDIRTYHYGTIPLQAHNQSYRIVVVTLPNMGNVPAANAMTDTIARWNPQFVLMVGIAGGVPKDNLDLGDVVVAKQIVGYEYSKVTDEGTKSRDRVYPASALLLERVVNFWDDTWTRQIGVERPTNARRPASQRYIGLIASGDKVIASTEFRQQLTKRWPELMAVETESEGVFAAVFDRPHIVNALAIRGICDMADERKLDEWQEYAANAAAAYAVQFLASGPVEASHE